ncbi:MAG: acyl-CoA dehydrogenase [Planctomycetota bacterium]
MPYNLTEDQLAIREMVRDFALNEVEPIAAEVDENSRFPEETFKKMADLGLMGVPFPEEFGGAGADNVSYAITVEEISRVCGSTGLSLAAHTSLGTAPIYEFASEEQKRKYVPDLASGKKLGAFGLTEPNAGSDAAGTQTTAVRDGDHYIVNGSKIFITNANYASTFIITAMTDKSKGAHGISAFIMEKDTPGFKVGKKDEKLGTRGSDWAELVFEDCRIPAENLVGNEGEGFIFFMKTLDGGRVSIGSMALGIAQGALDKSIEYAKERVQFGRPLAKFGAIQEKLATMATEVEAARHLVYASARLKDAKKIYTQQAAMGKLFASEVAVRAAREAIQIYGGNGFSREYPVERYFRDAKLCEIGEGTSEVQRLVIARNLCK